MNNNILSSAVYRRFFQVLSCLFVLLFSYSFLINIFNANSVKAELSNYLLIGSMSSVVYMLLLLVELVIILHIFFGVIYQMYIYLLCLLFLSISNIIVFYDFINSNIHYCGCHLLGIQEIVVGPNLIIRNTLLSLVVLSVISYKYFNYKNSMNKPINVNTNRSRLFPVSYFRVVIVVVLLANIVLLNVSLGMTRNNDIDFDFETFVSEYSNSLITPIDVRLENDSSYYVLAFLSATCHECIASIPLLNKASEMKDVSVLAVVYGSKVKIQYVVNNNNPIASSKKVLQVRYVASRRNVVESRGVFG